MLADGLIHRPGLLLLLLAAVATGCGPGGRVRLGKVSGRVSYNGSPVGNAMIVFHPPSGRPATGSIIDGEIEDVTTYDVPGDGAPIGKMQVTIHPLLDLEEIARRSAAGSGNTRPLIPVRYADPSTSNLKVEIHKGDNEVSFNLVD